MSKNKKGGKKITKRNFKLQFADKITRKQGKINSRRFDCIPTGIKVKSEILFSIVLMTLSRPLARNVPELVRTLWTLKVNRPYYATGVEKRNKNDPNLQIYGQ